MKRDVWWYLNRIRQMDTQEVLWRIRSEIRDLVDIARFKIGAFPKAVGPLPNAGFQVCHGTATEYRHSLGETGVSELVAEAELLLSNQLTFFGRTVDLGSSINWHRDWHSKVTAPLKPCYFVDYRDAPRFGDCKEVWEPNRHHQLVVLARAYVATENRQYADKVVQLLNSWIDANPFGYGMNWRSPLELAVRLINWVWAIDMISASGALTPADSAKIHRSVYLHCWELARKFSQGSSANNHLIGEAAGLYIASMYWFPEKTDWIQSAKRILEREIVSQSFDSGCTKEQALSYQFFVIQFFTFCGLVDRWNQSNFPPQYWARLLKQYEFVAEFEQFGDHLPFFGDKDDGYVLNLGPSTYDVRDLMAWQARLRGESSTEHAPSVLLIGPSPLAPSPLSGDCAPDRSHTKLFEDAGYALLKSDTNPAAICLLDAGPLGYGRMAAHGHADALHFAYSRGKQPFFVDSGTYDYFTYAEQRAYFRSTQAHNTIRLDHIEQSETSGPFMWKSGAEATLALTQQEGLSAVRGSITRYSALEQDVEVCERTLSLDPATGALRLNDRVKVARALYIEQFFHLHPSVEIQQNDDHFLLRSGNQTLKFKPDQQLKVELHDTGPLSQISEQYHQLQQSTCIRMHGLIEGEVQLATSIDPIEMNVEVAA